MLLGTAHSGGKPAHFTRQPGFPGTSYPAGPGLTACGHHLTVGKEPLLSHFMDRTLRLREVRNLPGKPS